MNYICKFDYYINNLFPYSYYYIHKEDLLYHAFFVKYNALLYSLLRVIRIILQNFILKFIYFDRKAWV